MAAGIEVCGPHDDVPPGALRLTVSSRAPAVNPSGWRDLWRLSPLSIVEGGVTVPGLGGIRSKTVENAWQFLKVWPGEDSWDQDEAMAAFESDCAIRYPRGPRKTARGHYWGETGEIIGYVEARKRIYVPAYSQLLALPDRQELIRRLRAAAEHDRVVIWDPDSYRPSNYGFRGIEQTLEHLERPFAHAFIVALAVQDRLDALAAQWA